jgi:oxygen-independent coproporphyrinogen-3 oxidase
LQGAVSQAQSSGLLHADATHIRPTERGFDFLNDLQALFLPPSSRP